GLIVDVISATSTGTTHPFRTMPKDPQEIQNMFYSIGASGKNVTIFDNVSGVFGNDALDAALTKSKVSARKFHTQKELNLYHLNRLRF
ncbi:MAG TPA: hypothetical protein VIT23_11940, partial [Terrimicrobiaceae bacterium]